MWLRCELYIETHEVTYWIQLIIWFCILSFAIVFFLFFSIFHNVNKFTYGKIKNVIRQWWRSACITNVLRFLNTIIFIDQERTNVEKWRFKKTRIISWIQLFYNLNNANFNNCFYLIREQFNEMHKKVKTAKVLLISSNYVFMLHSSINLFKLVGGEWIS